MKRKRMYVYINVPGPLNPATLQIRPPSFLDDKLLQYESQISSRSFLLSTHEHFLPSSFAEGPGASQMVPKKGF